jgi:hypothetical protein
MTPVSARPVTTSEPPPAAVRFQEWKNLVPNSFLDRPELGHRLGWALLVLEGRCRARCSCWVGNEDLAQALRLSVRATIRILGELEAEGWILRIEAPPGQPGRIGILLLRRANPDLPVASREEIAEAILRLKLAKSATFHGRKRPAPGDENVTRFGCRKRHPNKNEGLNKDEINDRSIEFACAREGENAQSPQTTQTIELTRAEEAVADLARELQGRVYAGFDPGIAAADWNQWAARYRGVARDVQAGRLAEGQVEEAIGLARRPGSECRGKRFFGAVRDFKAGRPPRGLAVGPRAEAPPPAAVVVAPAAPVEAPPPVSVPPPPPVSVPPPEIQPLATPDQVEEARDVIRQFGPKHPAGRLAAQFLRDHGLDPVPAEAVTAPPPAPEPGPAPVPVPVPTLGRVRRGRGGQTADQIRGHDRANLVESRDRLAAQIEADPDHMLAPAWRKALDAILESLDRSPDPDPSA